MTGIVLAECHGQVWLVEGDEHIDAVLRGQLPEGVPVEYLTLPNRGAVIDMWMERSAEADEGGMPWLINPALLGRIRGVFAPGVRTIAFAPWSVLLDGVAKEALAEAARWLAADPARRLTLRQFASDPQAPGQRELQMLRAQLARGALAEIGAEKDRVADSIAPATDGADAERMDIIEEAAS